MISELLFVDGDLMKPTVLKKLAPSARIINAYEFEGHKGILYENISLPDLYRLYELAGDNFNSEVITLNDSGQRIICHYFRRAA